MTKLMRAGLWSCAVGFSILIVGCGTTYHPYRVVNESMLPLLHPGDRIFVDESAEARSDLHDGDVIALRRDDAVVLKRIVATPGETIAGKVRKVFRNGKQIDEPYVAPAIKDDPPAPMTFSPRTVAVGELAVGELFVMGDNRDLSFDSRAAEYAPVLLSDVVGQYRWTYWHAPAVK
jgi:signal peptidase I